MCPLRTIIPPALKLWGWYTGVTMSICMSVSLSVCTAVDMTLRTAVQFLLCHSLNSKQTCSYNTYLGMPPSFHAASDLHFMLQWLWFRMAFRYFFFFFCLLDHQNLPMAADALSNALSVLPFYWKIIGVSRWGLKVI